MHLAPSLLPSAAPGAVTRISESNHHRGQVPLRIFFRIPHGLISDSVRRDSLTNSIMNGIAWLKKCLAHPGAAATLAKVTGVIVTVRVPFRRAGGAEHPPIQPAQRENYRVLGAYWPFSLKPWYAEPVTLSLGDSGNGTFTMTPAVASSDSASDNLVTLFTPPRSLQYRKLS